MIAVCEIGYDQWWRQKLSFGRPVAHKFSFGRTVDQKLEGQMGFSEFQGQDPSSGSGDFVPQKLKQFACICQSLVRLKLTDILQGELWGRC